MSITKKLSTLTAVLFILAPSLSRAAWYEQVPQLAKCANGSSGGYANPLQCWTNTAYNYSLGVIGFLAFFIIVVAGILYMTSAGNPERIKKSKQYLTGAFLGVGLLVLAKIFLKFAETIFGWDGLIVN